VNNNQTTTMMVNRRAVALSAAAVLAASGVGFIASTAQASGGGTDHTVTYCHRRNSETNPYGPKPITTDKAAVFSKGHDGHTGPVFQPGMKADKDKWGDIIPPFDYVDNKGVTRHYDGMNWTAQGQAILENGCQVPGTTPPPTTTTSTTPPVTTTHTTPPVTVTSTTSTTSTSPAPTTSTTTPPVENPSGDAGFGTFCDTENNGGKVSFGGNVYNFNAKSVNAHVSTAYGSADVTVAAQDRAMVKIKTNVYDVPSGSATVTLTWADGSPGSTTFESSYDGVKCAATPPPTTTTATQPPVTTTTAATPPPVTTTTTAVVTPPATTTTSARVSPRVTKTVKVITVQNTTGSTPQNGSIPIAAHTGSIGEDNSGRMFGGIAALAAALFLGLWSFGGPKAIAARATRRQ
jgi:hypothetical protein